MSCNFNPECDGKDSFPDFVHCLTIVSVIGLVAYIFVEVCKCLVK